MAFAYTLNSDKSLATVEHSFRTVEVTGDDGVKQKLKRPSISFQFTPFTGSDDLKVNAIINESLAQYGKILIAENGDNWDYIPGIDDINVSALYTYQSAPSARGNRLINKITLGEISEAYVLWATQNGKTESQANTGAKVIRNQFKDILGNETALNAMLSNLTQFAESDQVTELSPESLNAFTRLIENLSELTNPQITADSL